MSKSLVKKSLKILEERSSKPKDHSKDKNNKKRKIEALDLIPDNKKLVKYVGKKGHKKAKYELKTSTKLTMVEAKKQLANKKDRTEENVQKLLRLSKSNFDEKSASQLFSKAKKGHYQYDLVDNSTAKTSVFTEEDFENFEKDYFCS